MSLFFKVAQTALLCTAAFSPLAVEAELSQPPSRIQAPTLLKPEVQIPVPGKTFVGNNPDPRFAGYLKDWIAQIGQSKFESLTPGDQGQSFVSAEIGRNGQLVRLRLLRSSGNRVFDSAVLSAINRAAPFAPISEGMVRGTEVLVINRAFSFAQQDQALADAGSTGAKAALFDSPESHHQLVYLGAPDMKRCGIAYPPESLRAEETGVTRLLLLLTPEGEVLAAKVEISSGHPRLDEAAIDSFALCTFPPRKIDGVPVLGWERLDYEWRLTD
ncbi:energy transducer TonB [Niveibacterium terrae]|uniref:energy transducer TonB n=1 Tax=Niveibacterium terrae TaxID=3373598 RepID=UPI003A8FC234